MESHQYAFIIAQRAQMRDSLEILLHSIPGIEVVFKMADLSEALDHSTDNESGLVVYAFESGSDSLDKLESLKHALPGSQIIVLLDDENMYAEIEKLGDICLPNGMLAARLAEVIEDLVVLA